MVEFNFGYLIEKEGIFRLVELIVGYVCIGMYCYYLLNLSLFISSTIIFTCGVTLMLLAIIFGSGMDTTYDGIFSLFAFALILGGSIDHLIQFADQKVLQVIAAGLGIGLSILYLISAIFAFKK